MKIEDFNWFDKKYSSREMPSLEDKAALFSKLDIPLTDRQKRKIEDSLKEGLHELQRSYSKGLHVVTHQLLFCFAPLIGIEENRYHEYLRLYRKAMEKHKEAITFSQNFK